MGSISFTMKGLDETLAAIRVMPVVVFGSLQEALQEASQYVEEMGKNNHPGWENQTGDTEDLTHSEVAASVEELVLWLLSERMPGARTPDSSHGAAYFLEITNPSGARRDGKVLHTQWLAETMMEALPRILEIIEEYGLHADAHYELTDAQAIMSGDASEEEEE